MSRIDKKEIDEELSHQRDILKRLRENYRTLEKQEVSFGLSVPPHIVSEMSRLTERIQQITERIEHLEIQSVEENYSLAEAEYRVIAAEAWQNGYLTTYTKANLELSRLRLKLEHIQANKIENEVRSTIIDDIFFIQDIRYIWATAPNKEHFRNIITAIRLNYQRLIEVIIADKLNRQDLSPITDNHLSNIETHISRTSSLRGDEKDTLIKDFIKSLKAEMQKHKLYYVVDKN